MKDSKFYHWTHFLHFDVKEVSGEDVLDILKNHFNVEYKDRMMREIENQFRDNATHLLKSDYNCPIQFKPLVLNNMMKTLDALKKKISEARDQELIEDTIQEIMDNRGVNREEAEKIMRNPF